MKLHLRDSREFHYEELQTSLVISRAELQIVEFFVTELFFLLYENKPCSSVN